MTPEEMGAALGAGWVLSVDGPGGSQRLVLSGVSDGMEVWEYGGEWFVEVGADHHRRSYNWCCPTPEAAVAVAHLLAAAERLADDCSALAPNRGAAGQFVEAYAFQPVFEPGGQRLPSPRDGKVCQADQPKALTPAEARRSALHLLRAADTAEAHPTDRDEGDRHG